jgi:hypothetical protein
MKIFRKLVLILLVPNCPLYSNDKIIGMVDDHLSKLKSPQNGYEVTFNIEISQASVMPDEYNLITYSGKFFSQGEKRKTVFDYILIAHANDPIKSKSEKYIGIKNDEEYIFFGVGDSHVRRIKYGEESLSDSILIQESFYQLSLDRYWTSFSNTGKSLFDFLESSERVEYSTSKEGEHEFIRYKNELARSKTVVSILEGNVERISYQLFDAERAIIRRSFISSYPINSSVFLQISDVFYDIPSIAEERKILVSDFEFRDFDETFFSFESLPIDPSINEIIMLEEAGNPPEIIDINPNISQSSMVSNTNKQLSSVRNGIVSPERLYKFGFIIIITTTLYLLLRRIYK